MTSCTAPNREENLDAGIRSFLSDRNNDMVVGIRRMGRDALVDRVMEVASDMGLDCHLSDDASPDACVVVFRHWQDMDPDTARMRWPDSDIIFGQDLCHQVPAVVRLR